MEKKKVIKVVELHNGNNMLLSLLQALSKWELCIHDRFKNCF